MDDGWPYAGMQNTDIGQLPRLSSHRRKMRPAEAVGARPVGRIFGLLGRVSLGRGPGFRPDHCITG